MNVASSVRCVLFLECVLVGSQARIFEEHNQADGGDTNCAEISSSRTSCRLCHVDPFINMLWLSAPPSADNGGGVQHPFLRTPAYGIPHLTGIRTIWLTDGPPPFNQKFPTSMGAVHKSATFSCVL